MDGAAGRRGDRAARARLAIAVLTGCLVAAACASPRQPSAAEVEAARGRADAAAERLTTTLMARLTAALGEGGPTAAVDVCSQVAQEVTRSVGEGEGLMLRRTALRTRNPANAPADWERAWLERADAAVRAGQAPQPTYEVVTPAAGRAELRHLRPILFPGGVCSTCHGSAEEIPAEVRTLLRARYPEDAATGFRPGDLRGAISVRVPLAP